MLIEDEYTPEDEAMFQAWIDIQDIEETRVILLPIEETVVEFSNNKVL